MRRLALVSILFVLALPSIHPTATRPIAAPLQVQNRLVVFEMFTGLTWVICEAAGLAVEQLASEYADQPVVFLENTESSPGKRQGRWWMAHTSSGGGSATPPLVMVDSGYQVRNGFVDYDTMYKAMVAAALARPARAEIQASTERVGDTLRFDIQVTNLSGAALGADNDATVHAIVYEGAQGNFTNRIVCAATATGISPDLAPNETVTLTLETELSDVDWSKIHPLVLADYRPGGSTGAYDMLQAALAPCSKTFTVQPDALTFMVDPTGTSSPSAGMNLEGPYTLTWTTAIDGSWMAIAPTSGTIAIQPTVSVMTNTLSPGWQQGVITFTANSTDIPVPVSAYYGMVSRVYLPTVLRGYP